MLSQLPISYLSKTTPMKISSRQKCTDEKYCVYQSSAAKDVCRSLSFQLHFSIFSFLSRLQRPLETRTQPAVHFYFYLQGNSQEKGELKNQGWGIYKCSNRNMRETVHFTASQSSTAPILKPHYFPPVKKMVKNCLNWARIYNLTLLAKLQISFARSVDFESIRYIQLRVGRRSDYCAGETQ